MLFSMEGKARRIVLWSRKKHSVGTRLWKRTNNVTVAMRKTVMMLVVMLTRIKKPQRKNVSSRNRHSAGRLADFVLTKSHP